MVQKCERLRASWDNSALMKRHPPLAVVERCPEMRSCVESYQNMRRAFGEQIESAVPHLENMRGCEREAGELVTQLDAVCGEFPGILEAASKAQGELADTAVEVLKLTVLKEARARCQALWCSDVESAWQEIEREFAESSGEREVLQKIHRFTADKRADIANQISSLRQLLEPVAPPSESSRHRVAAFESWCRDDCDRSTASLNRTASAISAVVQPVRHVISAGESLESIWSFFRSHSDISDNISARSALTWCDSVISALNAEIESKKAELASIEAKAHPCPHKKSKCVTSCGHTFCDSCLAPGTASCPACGAAFQPSDVIEIHW